MRSRTSRSLLSEAESETSCAYADNLATGDGENSREQPLFALLVARLHTVELHWYEAHGIGKKKMKIKRFLS